MTAICRRCGEKLEVRVVVCDETAADFLEGVPCDCSHCGRVLVDWDDVEFFSLTYRPDDEDKGCPPQG